MNQTRICTKCIAGTNTNTGNPCDCPAGIRRHAALTRQLHSHTKTTRALRPLNSLQRAFYALAASLLSTSEEDAL
jgi:hypothetical protein